MEQQFDPFQFKRPRREVRHLTFIDSAQPGMELKLSLRRADTVDMARAASEIQRMAELYLTGSDDMPAGPFPLVGGEPVPVSMELFSQACAVFVMQAPEGESKQPRMWAPEQLVAISVTMPDAWSQILRACEELRRAGRGAEGNSPAPPTAS
jgi:hypothetical protein